MALVKHPTIAYIIRAVPDSDLEDWIGFGWEPVEEVSPSGEADPVEIASPSRALKTASAHVPKTAAKGVDAV